MTQARWIVGRDLREGRVVDLFPGYVVRPETADDVAVWLLYPTRASPSEGAGVH